METEPDVRFLARGSGKLRELIGRREAVSQHNFLGVFLWARRSARLDWEHEAVGGL